MSFVTMTRIALGEFDSIYPDMVDINPMAAFVIIATYQVIFSLLCWQSFSPVVHLC